MHNTIVGVDLSKDVIQVCVASRKVVISNKELTPEAFHEFLITSQPFTIVFETCATSNYWQQIALNAGHDAKLISAKLVSRIRQDQKTDKNDAMAVVQCAQLTNVRYIMGKVFKQQELQSLLRMRQLAKKHKVALSNQINALLLEFNIRRPKKGGLSALVQHVLEDADNGFSCYLREALYECWQALLQTAARIDSCDNQLRQAVEEHPECKKLLALEGVGIINAIQLYVELGVEQGKFRHAREASACLGLTPIQHSTGGKTRLGSIGKYVKNQQVRSSLVNGMMAVIRQVMAREPRTTKEKWIQELVQRRGKLCAAVALANKTVRTAYAMLSKGTQYQAIPLVN